MKRTIQFDWDDAGDFQIRELKRIVEMIVAHIRLSDEFPDEILEVRLNKITDEIRTLRYHDLDERQRQ